MSAVLREQGIVTIHDQVVSLVAQRWAEAFHCKVTIHTGLKQNPWADPQRQCDIVGWQVSSAATRWNGWLRWKPMIQSWLSQPFQNGRRRSCAVSHSICSYRAASSNRHKSW
jgi:hypothetical protein